MFYTLTLNPAIDQVVEVNDFQLNITNKVVNQYQVFGGKGINVAIMLQNLGQKPVACGFLGSEHQQQFQNYLENKNIKTNFIILEGAIRTNLKIKSLPDMNETELNCLGFKVNQEAENHILKLLETTLTSDDFLIIAGSIPQNCSSAIYEKIASICNKKSSKFALDTSKTYLENCLKYQPFLIKPNLDELNEIFNSNYQTTNINEIIALGKRLQAKGAQNVLISFGKEGSLLIANNQKCYLSNTAKGKLINSVGAGDSMVAGFCSSYYETKNYQTALKVAAAAGAATAFSQDIGTKAKIDELINNINVTII